MTPSDARAKYVETVERYAAGRATVEEVAKAQADAAEVERAARRQALRETWTEWRPDHAKHVVGAWTARVFDDDGMPEEQTVKMRCEYPGCGATMVRKCSSGLVQQHVQRFAIVHLHRDVFHVRPRRVE
jgi:hypothetical protein